MTPKQEAALRLAADAIDEFCELGAIIRPLEVRDAIREALADNALDKMADNAKELGLDYEPIVEQVEDSVGMGHGAWDMVEPKKLAKAFHEALAEPKEKYRYGTPLLDAMTGKNEQPANVAAVNTSSERVDKTAKNVHEQPAQQEPQRWAVFCQGCRKEWSVSYPHPGKSICADCDDKLAQYDASPQPAQQEPVCDKDPRGCWSVRCQLGKVCKNKSPQPSKPWVGLSNDEIYDMYNEPRSDAEMVEFARAIEAKLKERNA